MKRLILTVALGVTLGLPLCGQAEVPSFPAAALAGRWHATTEYRSLDDDLSRSIYGPNARAMRTTTLAIEESGQGNLTITTRVLDRRGRTVPGTLTVDDAEFTVGTLAPPHGSRPQYQTTIVRAERRAPEFPNDRTTLDGLQVRLMPADGTAPTQLDVRVETAEGTGSFWETLRRQTPARRNTAKS